MPLKIYKPYTPSIRTKSTISFSNLSTKTSEKSLTFYNHRAKGRNNSGRITIRHKGSGHKKLYRQIDFKRNKLNVKGVVASIEYDPNRNCNISLIHYCDGEKRYILHPEGLKIGNYISSGKNSNISLGNSLPLEYIPLGTQVHNIEIIPGKGSQLIRSAGICAKILTKINNFVILRLPSKKIRIFRKECYATIGVIDNYDYHNINLGKAGRSRWLGIRPTVRGSAMNPIDHPHGGGEGKSPIGRKKPLTPWGKSAFGTKTKKRKKSDKYVINFI
jgi:large subunit ribosomal protein L2